eukprot:CAMPEP_0202450894 /NCGR_PEP_ID=MMETSP1360-20130828/9427_1 /ASSEMBLY_ACC=CAM_ASM_000848 /TAXON_ID=515479 /ORGANISM="Licmophora paradoxa, Strain CCMP2313" /LENGTH=104 /DNA_ID=CAMNT_0049069311 /DNA_START=352 /DNA_END=664 /DNA_ORIENTATION=-
MVDLRKKIQSSFFDLGGQVIQGQISDEGTVFDHFPFLHEYFSPLTNSARFFLAQVCLLLYEVPCELIWVTLLGVCKNDIDLPCMSFADDGESEKEAYDGLVEGW